MCTPDKNTVFKGRALSKALSVAGLMDPGHRFWLLVLYSSQNKSQLSVLIAEVAARHSITSCHLVHTDHVVVRLASQQLLQAQASLNNTDGRQVYQHSLPPLPICP